MKKTQRVRYEMFGRVRNFGIANREVFPESSAGGQKFGLLAAVVDAIEDHLTRRTQARTEARKVNAATRAAVIRTMKAIASTGRQAVVGETGISPFRMPRSQATATVLAAARYFMAEAERRKDKFVELGMPPAFLTDFAQQVEALEAAIGVQQDSRAARRQASAGIDSSIDRGNALVAQLDVTVTNAIHPDPVRLGAWLGARSVDDGPPSGPRKKPAVEPGTGVTPVQVTEEEDRKRAS